MEPTTAAMIAKAAIAVGTNKKVWTGIASVQNLLRCMSSLIRINTMALLICSTRKS